MRYIETRDVPITDLRPYPGNARVHAKAVLEESAGANGQYRSVVARTMPDGTLQLLAGHGTTEAFASIGAGTLRVEIVEADDAEARRIVLVDNRANDLAGYDDGLLAELLRASPDLDGTGYERVDVDTLIADLLKASRADQASDPDDAPALDNTTVITQPGDVWVLGDHRLVCGDSRDPAVLAVAVGEGMADCVWTDPPYGVDYVGKTKAAMTIRNDDAAGLRPLLDAVFAAVPTVCAPGAPVYVAGPAGPLHRQFVEAFEGAGWSLRQTLVWVKDVFVLGRSDYHYQHEPILYGYLPGGTGRRGRGGKEWFGGNDQSSVLVHDRPKVSTLHPTSKPVALVVQCINNSCRPGGVVLEPFGGSGSTLIAAHLTGRRARLVELDPVYVDVICRRFQKLTGTVPVRESDGKAVNFLL